ncbi:MAG TPA: hypothetical protein PLK63_04375 [Catalimonadaceae bacterium]|nr:hypothetical protein [Catalimonadaceae bacterium]
MNKPIFGKAGIRTLLLMCVLSISSTFHIRAQEYDLLLGYGAGQFGRGVNNFKNEIYRLNHFKYSDLKDPVESPGFFHGVDIGFMARMEEKSRFYYTANWTNKHMVANGSGTDSKSGNSMDISFKIRHNNFSCLAFGYRIKPWLGIAFSPVDFGTVKVFYKNSSDDDFKSYKPFYNVETGILSGYSVYGYSLYLDLILQNRFRVRAAWYRSRGGVSLRDRNDPLVSYHYNPNNISVSLCYMLHLKRD